MRTELQAYGTALINSYERRCEFNTPLRFTLKEVIKDIGLMIDYVMDLQEVDGKSTLEVESSLRENVRAYKDTLSDKECTITTLAMDLNSLGYIEQENKMLEADNLRLKSQLAMCTVNENIIRELRAEKQVLLNVINIEKIKMEKLTGPKWFLD